jgi:aminoglycoside phosphotransferase
MLHYTEKEIKDMARSIVGEISFIKAVGNHELGRHLVYHVKAKSGPSIILKLYYKKDRRSREIASLRLLSGSGVKCPSLLDYGILDDGTEWATTEYLEGEVFGLVGCWEIAANGINY